MSVVVPDELPAVLYGAWLLDQFSSDEEKLAYLEGRLSAPDRCSRWDELSARQRGHWEVVAKHAVEFILGEKGRMSLR